MASQIIVTASDVQRFLARNDNPHILRRGDSVQIVGERYYRMYGGRLITTRADLAAVDPQAHTYNPAMLAELLSDFATHMED